jgi:hypothetical protein
MGKSSPTPSPLPTFEDVIATIRQARDLALAVVEHSISVIENQIAATTQRGPMLQRLADRDDALISEAAAIRAAATDTVLALPAVQQASQTLTKISQDMQKVAKNLPSVTEEALTTTADALSLAQKFVDTIVTAQSKPS